MLLCCAIVFVDTSFYSAMTPLLPGVRGRVRALQDGAPACSPRPIRPGTLAGALPGGYLAARAGVRATVLLGLALMSVASVAFAFAGSIAVLDAARFLQGIGGAASWAGALAWVAGAAPRERRGEMIGTALGAAIAGALSGRCSARSPTRSASRPCSAASRWSACCSRVGAAHAARRAGGDLVAGGAGWPRCGTRAWRGGMWLIAVPGLMFGTIGVLGPLRLDELGLGAAAIGAVWLCAALLEAGVSPVVGRVSDRRGRLFPSLLGLALGAVLMLLFPLAAGAVAAHRRSSLLASPTIGHAVGALDGAALRRRRGGRHRPGLRVRAEQRGLVDRADGAARRGARGIADATSDAVPYLLLVGARPRDLRRAARGRATAGPGSSRGLDASTRRADGAVLVRSHPRSCARW